MPITFNHLDIDQPVLMSAYYRNSDGFLRQINSYAYLEDVELVRQAVISGLQATMEQYQKPVLVAICGGKA